MKKLPFIVAMLCLVTILHPSGRAQNLPSGQEASDQTGVTTIEKTEASDYNMPIAGKALSIPASNVEPDAAPVGKISLAVAIGGEKLLARQSAPTPEVLLIQTNASVRKRNGLIMAGVGIAAIAFGAVTYSMLNKDHKDYKNTIANAEGITSYASPGIYIAGGAAVAGLGLSLASIPKFLKAR